MRRACVFVVVMLVVYTLSAVLLAEPSTQQYDGIDAYARWKTHLDEVSKSKHLILSSDGNDPTKPSYLDRPYPTIQDNGVPEGKSPDGLPPIGFENCVSDVVCMNMDNLGPYFWPSSGAGNFLVGESHELFIGDQNGNGIMEIVVFYFYVPWTNDGIDNDGDGCVDEKFWEAGAGCDSVPDAVVVYETESSPVLGGEDGTLVANVDWYSGTQVIKIFRIFASPPWGAYVIRGYIHYPQIAGDFIQYSSSEYYMGVNVNAGAGDKDLYDGLIGNIDARGFPLRAPVNHFCIAGSSSIIGGFGLREDGTAVGAVEMYENDDNHRDWNKDGDYYDYVVAYYVVDPVTGTCNKGVNTQVHGWWPRVSAKLVVPGYTWESSDRRDWTGDGDTIDTVTVYHEIASSISLAGTVYTSYTWTALREPFGHGYTGAALQNSVRPIYPLNFGGTVERYVGMSQGYYKTAMFLTGDDDGIPNTLLPEYLVGYGQPGGVLGGKCIGIYARERNLRYAGVKLIGGLADGNGDGDYGDMLGYIFCPDTSGGGGHYIVEPTSKYSKGYYQDPIPFIWLGYAYFDTAKVIGGLTTIPIMRLEYDLGFECNWDFDVDSSSRCDSYYQVYL